MDARGLPARRDSLAVLTTSGGYDSSSKRLDRFDKLPSDVPSLVRITQGLGIYDVVAAEFYGCRPSQARQNDIHLRAVAQRLDRIVALAVPMRSTHGESDTRSSNVRNMGGIVGER